MPDPHTNGQGDWGDIVVSIVPNAWETKTTDISLGAALEKIRNGRWAKPLPAFVKNTQSARRGRKGRRP